MRAITVEAGDDILGAYTIPGQFVQIKEKEDTKVRTRSGVAWRSLVRRGLARCGVVRRGPA